MIIISYIVGGLVFGIFGGPLIIYALGSIVVYIRNRKVRKDINRMVQEHNHEIRKIQKQYEAAKKKFNKKSRKIQRILAKAKGG